MGILAQQYRTGQTIGNTSSDASNVGTESKGHPVFWVLSGLTILTGFAFMVGSGAAVAYSKGSVLEL